MIVLRREAVLLLGQYSPVGAAHYCTGGYSGTVGVRILHLSEVQKAHTAERVLKPRRHVQTTARGHVGSLSKVQVGSIRCGIGCFYTLDWVSRSV